MNRMRMEVVVLLLSGLALSGCAAVAVGTAGGLIVDEGISENDGRFDPLEDTLLDGIYD
ncbi:MAG TPA: hypothetical protein VFJ13_07305 [Paracoccaceae bacterium]|nr:hypothetical protein [Paracoccaceae bacterium]